MIKKKLIVIFLLIAITVFSSCYYEWKTIRIDGVGSFKVPKEWVFTEEDGLVFLTDKPIDESDYSIYFIEPIKFFDDNQDLFISHKLFGNAKHINEIKNNVLSNSAYYGQEEYELNGKLIRKHYVLFSGENNDLELIAWDDLVDEDTIKKIAESYVMEIDD